MLVLTRKNRESLVVGDPEGFEQLRITVLEVRRGKVILGVEGDPEVPVYRSEIWERISPADTRRIASSCR